MAAEKVGAKLNLPRVADADAQCSAVAMQITAVRSIGGRVSRRRREANQEKGDEKRRTSFLGSVISPCRSFYHQRNAHEQLQRTA